MRVITLIALCGGILLAGAPQGSAAPHQDSKTRHRRVRHHGRLHAPARTGSVRTPRVIRHPIVTPPRLRGGLIHTPPPEIIHRAQQREAPPRPAPPAPPPGRASTAVGAIDQATKNRIDQWIQQNHRNPYGDPPGTMYAGGTPLFDERTGRSTDKYEYILRKHPELRNAR